jgi:predicted TPR repeat methyltransferase
MIRKAAEKQVYDNLVVGELTEVMSASNSKYDVVLSADVFVYIGNLDRVFAASRNILKPGGLFVFSTEAADNLSEKGFLLRDSGRYAHTLQYIRELTYEYRFQEIMLKEAVIRMESNKPIDGRIFLLRRQAS